MNKLDAYTLTRKRNRRQNTATIRRTRSGTRGQKACRQHRDRATVLAVAVAVAVDNGEIPIDDDRATWNGRGVQCCFGPICLDSDVADVSR